MSRENIEVLRKGYEAWNRGEHPAFDFMEPQFELQLPEGGINVGTVRGRESVQRFFAQYLEVFESYRMEPEEFFAAEDQIVVFIHAPARGKGSGVDVVFSAAHLWTMNGGRAVRLEVFPDRKEALEAVGLLE
jgi:ketosteroid isomerase-like protein